MQSRLESCECRKYFYFPFLMFLCASVLIAQENTEKLGTVHFPVSCSAEAQIQFDRAVAMLHNFWYPQDLNAFFDITKTDSNCAMAYWGMAMSLRGNPLASPPEPPALKRGWEAIEKARTVGVKSERDQGYLRAIEAYYRDWEKVDRHTRVLAYESAMEQLYGRYREDPEAAVFYALALNEATTVLPADKTYARQLKAAAILETVLAAQPEHPGALHYLIHSYDFHPLAIRGLPAAQRYAAVAPSAPHALHMPSHIYSMLGMWPESIQSNQNARHVANDYVHAMDFMVYAYLQEAQDVQARSLVDESILLQKAKTASATLNPTGAVLGTYTAFAAIPARYAIEREAWAEAAALEPQHAFPAADATIYFSRAMGSIHSGDVASARKDIGQLQLLKADLLRSKDDYWAEQVEIQLTAATAWVALADRKQEEAVNLMRAAADLEDRTEKHVAMENRLWPMRELLGEMLLSLNHAGQALEELEASLQSSPNRFRGFYVAAKAADQSGNQEKAKMYYGKLIAMCGQAETERPELVAAKAFLANAPVPKTTASISGEEPSAMSRSELLKQERVEKEKHLTPYKLSWLEKRLLASETKGFRESLGLRFGDFYFSEGGVTTGAGISATARYFRANLFDSPIDLSLSLGYSLKQYKVYSFQIGNVLRKSPDLFLRSASSGGMSLFSKTKEREGDLFLYAEISYRDFTQEDFFGLGNDSEEDDRTDYRLTGASYEGVGAVRFGQKLGAFIRAGIFQPELRSGKDSLFPNTPELFDDTTAPGLDEQPDFLRVATQIFYDYRDFPGNAHHGGLFGVTLARFFDQDGDQFDFYRIAVDARQYIPLGSEQRVLALRFYTSLDEELNGARVPFYLMQTLGGSDSLRGYSNFRFRDKNLFLMSAEYRWEPAPAVELVLFYDTGKVFPDRSDFDFSDLNKGYGFGLRFKTEHNVPMRLDIGHSKEGTNIYLKWAASF